MISGDHFIFNPASRHGATRGLAGRVRAALEREGLTGEWRETEGPGHAAALAADAAEAGAARVVAVGGDGTVNEVVAGLMRAPATGRPAFGLLPLGTGNDFAKTLGLTAGDVAGAARVLRAGAARRLDVGEVNGRTFANGFGLGFDGAVAERAARFKRLGGVAAYVASVVATLTSWTNFRLTVSVDGETLEGRSMLACVSLGRSCGGGFYLTPDAVPDDGLFDLCVLGDFGRLEALRHLPRALTGAHRHLAKARLLRGREVTLSSDRPLVAHLDGNLMIPAGAPEPLVFRLHPQALEAVGRW